MNNRAVSDYQAKAKDIKAPEHLQSEVLGKAHAMIQAAGGAEAYGPRRPSALKRSAWFKTTAIAACCILLVGLGAFAFVQLGNSVLRGALEEIVLPDTGLVPEGDDTATEDAPAEDAADEPGPDAGPDTAEDAARQPESDNGWGGRQYGSDAYEEEPSQGTEPSQSPLAPEEGENGETPAVEPPIDTNKPQQPPSPPEKETPTKPDPAKPDPAEPDPTEPDPTEPDPVEPDPVEPDPVEPDPVAPDPIPDSALIKPSSVDDLKENSDLIITGKVQKVSSALQLDVTEAATTTAPTSAFITVDGVLGDGKDRMGARLEVRMTGGSPNYQVDLKAGTKYLLFLAGSGASKEAGAEESPYYVVGSTRGVFVQTGTNLYTNSFLGTLYADAEKGELKKHDPAGDDDKPTPEPPDDWPWPWPWPWPPHTKPVPVEEGDGSTPGSQSPNDPTPQDPSADGPTRDDPAIVDPGPDDPPVVDPSVIDPGSDEPGREDPGWAVIG